MNGIQDIWFYANKIIRNSRQLINEGLKPLGLSSAEGNILFHILTRGQECAQEELVEVLDISKPAVSRALESLEGKGFITREHDPLDKRARRVRLTPKALQRGAQVQQVYQDVFSAAARGVTEQDIAAFIDLFRAVSENLSGVHTIQEVK
jgi:MarR family transcriptional regulator, transcriptional regulator for hemolysin